MIKISLNISKLDTSRARSGTTNPDSKHLTLLLKKKEKPDDTGYDYALMQAQTLEERKSGAKKLYVGKGKEMTLGITDEDSNKFYMLFIEGGNTPTVKHIGIKTAFYEANRLAKKTGLDVYVLEVSGIVISKKIGISPELTKTVQNEVETLTAAAPVIEEPKEEAQVPQEVKKVRKKTAKKTVPAKVK